MAANRQIDLTPLMATAQVALNVCSLPMNAREKLAAIAYTAEILKHAANAALEQIDLHQSRGEVQS